MMISISVPIYLVLLANAALIVATAYTMLRVQRVLGERAGSTPSVGPLAASDSRARDEIRGLAQRLDRMQGSVDRLQTVASVDVGATRTMPMQHAVELVKRGATQAELTETFGLTVGEARLLSRLHGQNERTARSSAEASGV